MTDTDDAARKAYTLIAETADPFAAVAAALRERDESLAILYEEAVRLKEGWQADRERIAALEAALRERDERLRAFETEECHVEECGVQRVDQEAFTCTNCYQAAKQRIAALEAERAALRAEVEELRKLRFYGESAQRPVKP